MPNFDTDFPELLGDPAQYGYSARQYGGNVAGNWRTWATETHIERIYERCDALLAEIQRLKAEKAAPSSEEVLGKNKLPAIPPEPESV